MHSHTEEADMSQPQDKGLRIALWRAKRTAKRTQSMRYIVLEDGDYCVASDEEMDTFYAGSPALYAVTPSGNVEN